jgi:hypothetical protein
VTYISSNNIPTHFVFAIFAHARSCFCLVNFSSRVAILVLLACACMQLWQQSLAAIAVGLLWGISNPLTRQGALQLKRRQQSDPLLLSADGRGWLRTVNHVRHTPLLILPQVRCLSYTI